jgi:DMSO/TMAO reductase YedYZ molybdopterin-dependent catalytic subunit
MNQTISPAKDCTLLTGLGKDPRLHIHEDVPINVETPLEALDAALTPREAFFMRNNHALGQIAPADWTLTIDGHVERPYTLAYTSLLSLPATHFVAFLECYGNSRGRFAEQGPPAEGIQWGSGAVANAEWTGVPVALLLQQAGVRPGAVQAECRSGGDYDFVRGVEVAKLLDDAILAYAMNGQPLPREHGGPVRLVVPGWGGINWVKWIVGMTVLDHESLSPYNQHSYVLIDRAGQVQGKAREIPVKSIIANLRPRSTLPAAEHLVQGFAWSSHGVRCVEVSADGGRAWQPATLLEDRGPRAWRQFVWRWDAAPGDYLLASRAIDLAGNIQPTTVAFNQKGYLMNAVELLPVKVMSPVLRLEIRD